MQVMPENIATLLKSKSMRRADKPAYRLTIEDNPIGGLSDPQTWTTWRYFAGAADNKGLGYMAETSDGRAVISYVENNKVYIAFAPTVTGILDGTETFDFDSAILVKEGNETGLIQTSLTLINGILHLAITNWTYTTEWVLQCEHWVDSNGLGEEFAFKNYISTDLSSGTSWARELPQVGNNLGQIVCLSETNWVIICPHWSYVYLSNRPCYTTDSGETWTNGEPSPKSLFYYLAGCGVSVLRLSDTSFAIAWCSSSSYEKLLHYTNCGAVLSAADGWGSDWPGGDDYVRGIGYAAVKDKVYMAVAGLMGSPYDIYEFKLDTPTYETIKLYENWTFIASVGYFGGGEPQFTATENALVLQHKDSGQISGAGTLIERRPLQVKKIEVTRQKGAASQLVVVLDNKNGRYSPDKEGAWFNVIWPNKRVVLEWGYGTDLAYGFTGLVDSVKMSTFPQELTFVCRDMLKLALDQTVTDEAGAHTIYYTNEKAEDIFLYLASAAGYASEDIVTEETGITLEGFLVSNETYADAFTRLCEISKFEYYCDAKGVLYFVHSTDRSPAVEGAAMVLTGTDWVDIPGVAAGHPVVLDSDMLTDGELAVYSRVTDYEIRLGGSGINAAVRRRPGSSIGDGAAVYVSAVYAAWVFSEGQDIVKLDYTIDDKDLYYTILVQGAAEDESVIEASASYISREYYNVLEQKILIVSASQIKDLATCQEIADRNEVLMRSRPRYTEFGAVANPWLDTGDCCQVIESSTTISEIYRPLSEIITMEPGTGFIMQLGAYHYGYAPI
ncbi:hypothetical protein ACOBQJ_13155 [Pelotomaculum propionicicum]|uniref:hypothetical protein n=1 Tax=Pelotomaculum propionicicum TaxID=258475 RepID=UPI003B80F974